MTDVPFGVLLSGGLDSSLVAAVASRYLRESEIACQWGSQLHTFCVGLEVSTCVPVNQFYTLFPFSPDSISLTFLLIHLWRLLLVLVFGCVL